MSTEHGLLGFLEELPREPAPPIPVEALLRRLAWRRFGVAAIGLALAGAVGLGFLLLRPEPKPPENLRLRVVNVGDPIDAPAEGPAELNLP